MQGREFQDLSFWGRSSAEGARIETTQAGAESRGWIHWIWEGGSAFFGTSEWGENAELDNARPYSKGGHRET